MHARLYGCLNISSKMLLHIHTFSVPQRGIGSSDKSAITVDQIRQTFRLV